MSRKPVQPFRGEEFNEGSTVFLDLTSLDETSALAIPTAMSYRIDDQTNSRQVLDWTTVTSPASVETLTITAAQNALNGRDDPKELRQVTVKTTSASGAILQTPFIYSLTRIFDSEDQLP